MNKLLIVSGQSKEYAQLLAEQDPADLEVEAFSRPDQARTAAADCSIILGDPDMVVNVLGNTRCLQWVQSTFAGNDALCVPGCRRDYLLTGIKGIFGPLISEYVFSYILALERNLFTGREQQRQKHWNRLPCQGLAASTIGICGLGSIGRHVAATAAHFNMRVLGLKRSVGQVAHVERVYATAELHAFLSELDYLVITLPLTPETEQLIDSEALQHMKNSSVLINAGRGNVIKEADLVRALTRKTIRAAVLDVFAREPLPQSSPLWTMENVFVTPHCAAVSVPEAVVRIFCDNYQLYRQGQPLHYIVNFEQGY